MILLLAFLFYIPALWHHYIIDELASLDYTTKNVPKPKNKLKYLWATLLNKYWEEIDSKTKRPKPNFLAHSIPIVSHLIVCLLIYLAFGRTQISYLVAILFALHPLNTEVSTGMGANHYGWTTILVLLIWMFPILAPIVYLFFSPFLFGFSGIFSPLVYLLRPDWLSVLALFTIWTVYKKWQIIFNPEKNTKLAAYSNNAQVLAIHPGKLIIMLKFYGYFLANSILGLHFSFYQSYMDDFVDTQEGIKKSYKLDRYFWIGLAGVFILITNLIWNYDFTAKAIPNMTIFGLFWATINILMWCNFVNTGQQYISNRYYYLANVGICLMLGSILIEHPYIAGCLIGWYARQLIYAIRQYKNVFWQFFSQITDEPKFYYSWIHWGNLMYHRGCYVAAIQAYLEALALRKDNFKALFNLSSAYLAKTNIKKAVEYLELARKADVYGQEKRAEEETMKRMRLINEILLTKGELLRKLTTQDIEVVA